MLLTVLSRCEQTGRKITLLCFQDENSTSSKYVARLLKRGNNLETFAVSVFSTFPNAASLVPLRNIRRRHVICGLKAESVFDVIFLLQHCFLACAGLDIKKHYILKDMRSPHSGVLAGVLGWGCLYRVDSVTPLGIRVGHWGGRVGFRSGCTACAGGVCVRRDWFPPVKSLADKFLVFTPLFIRLLGAEDCFFLLRLRFSVWVAVPWLA